MRHEPHGSAPNCLWFLTGKNHRRSGRVDSADVQECPVAIVNGFAHPDIDEKDQPVELLDQVAFRATAAVSEGDELALSPLRSLSEIPTVASRN